MLKKICFLMLKKLLWNLFHFWMWKKLCWNMYRFIMMGSLQSQTSLIFRFWTNFRFWTSKWYWIWWFYSKITWKKHRRIIWPLIQLCGLWIYQRNFIEIALLGWQTATSTRVQHTDSPKQEQSHMTVQREKLFGYVQCGKKFHHKSNCKRHEKTHLKIEPHGCPLFGQRFILTENLQKNIKCH